MATAGAVFLDVLPDMKGFQRNVGAQVKSSSSRFSGIGKTIGKSLGLGIGAGVAGVAVIGSMALEAGQQAAEINAQTEAVLKSTQGAAKLTADEITALAGRISAYSAIEDDLIQTGSNLLLTFTNIRDEAGKNNDIFTQSTEIMTDMSVALDQDMTSSAQQLGKALNDPIRGITALSRVGVTFTDKQRKQIEVMVESGDTMKAQKVILAELTKEFGGSARKVGNVKPWDKMKNAVGEVMESIGTALLPVVGELAEELRRFIESEEFQEWLETATEWLKENLPKAIKKAKNWFQNELKPALKTVGDALGPVVNFFGDLLGHIDRIAEVGGGVGNIIKNMIPGGQLLGIGDDGGPTVPGVFGGSALAMGTQLMGVFPGLMQTSAYRPGDPGFHGDASNPAGDYAMAGWPSDTSGIYTPQAAQIAQAAISMFGSNIRELIYGNMIYQNGQMGYYGANDHWGHIHMADKGGVFKGPGLVAMGRGYETFASGLRPAQRVGSAGPQTIRGKLTIVGGDAYIEGVVVDVMDSYNDTAAGLDRMRR